jgi:hypothetical protein
MPNNERVKNEQIACRMLYSGLFTSVCSLNANISEHLVCSIFIGAYEDGTDIVFRNVGI